jgi:hypothetical protein
MYILFYDFVNIYKSKTPALLRNYHSVTYYKLLIFYSRLPDDDCVAQSKNVWRLFKQSAVVGV